MMMMMMMTNDNDNYYTNMHYTTANTHRNLDAKTALQSTTQLQC